MKEVIVALARYNRGANLNLIETLEKAGAEAAHKETGTYYKTALGTIQHCVWYEVSWLKRYKALGDFASLRAAILDEELETLKAKVGEDFARLATLTKEIDSLYVSFTEEAQPEDLLKSITFKNFRGEDQERIVWQTVFHVLNHCTHHRGEISGALDRVGVSNDFAGFFRYL
ncbi:MAG: DinB family protein [Rectinemataceae bacterium]